MAHRCLAGTVNAFECDEACEHARGQRSQRTLNRCRDARLPRPHNVFIECDGSVALGDRLGGRVRFHGNFVRICGGLPTAATARPGAENAIRASSSSRMIAAKDIASTALIRSRFARSPRSSRLPGRRAPVDVLVVVASTA
jgi:hypothetical protein